MALLVLVPALAPSVASAQRRYLGPNKCTSCHDHEPQKAWEPKDKHSKALAQLEDKNASKYAGAIGLSDVYSLKGACVDCHATVYAGDANAGVSCETCHGPGSEYLEPHQVKGAYAKSVALGMIDTRGNYARWARLCVDCHIVTDRRLTAAGHPSGAKFDISVDSQKIRVAGGSVHWDESYDFAKLAAAGRVESARKGGGAAAQPAPVPKVTPTPAPTKEPKATRTPAPTKEPRATPTPAPATREPRATPTAVSPTRPDAVPSPTTRPALRESPTPKVMAPVTPTVTPPTEPAPPEAQPTPSAPTAAPTAAPTPSDIVIVIQATPISTVSPQVGARPTEVPKAIQTAAPEAEPRPSPTRRPTIRKKPRPMPTVRPRPRATVSIRKEPSPPAVSKALPTPTRTRVPAPRRTLRAPH